MKLFHFSDDPAHLFSGLSSILQSFQLIILSGGVSKGRFDFVPQILRDLHVQKVFHWVKQRPGKPMYFGTGKDNQTVFGLPGNPVSALICLRRYIVPLMLKFIGDIRPTKKAYLTKDISFKKNLTLFQAVSVWPCPDREGRLIAHPLTSNGSGDFSSLAESRGFLELPAQDKLYKKGSPYPFFNWGGVTI